MRISAPLYAAQARPRPVGLAEVNELRREVHQLTERTNDLYDQHITALSLASTAAVATAAGGAMTLLPMTRSLGLKVAGVAGLGLAAGIGRGPHLWSSRPLRKPEAGRRR